MSIYKITVEKIIEPIEAGRYPSKEEVFTQQINDIDVKALARFLNAESK